eukprot:2769672-Pleurochrysis_carterae.AAC.2
MSGAPADEHGVAVLGGKLLPHVHVLWIGAPELLRTFRPAAPECLLFLYWYAKCLHAQAPWRMPEEPRVDRCPCLLVYSLTTTAHCERAPE